MEFDWRVYDYNQKFFGESSPHTRLSLAIMTPHGRVKLQLRVVWNIPLQRFSAIYPHLAGERRCRVHPQASFWSDRAILRSKVANECTMDDEPLRC